MSDSRPIIVGGCYRSGTSLVRRLLDSHPRIHCGPEVKFFRDFYGDYLEAEDSIGHLRFMTTARSLLPEDEVLAILGKAFVEMHEQAAEEAGKSRWADKAPENVVFLEQWERLLGREWVFLHVVRNPLDTLASIEEVGFPKSIPAALGDRVDLYVEYARAGLNFADAHPERYLRVLYEDLVEDPEVVVRDLMAGLKESFHLKQLRINLSPHQTGLEDPKAARASEVHRHSIGRWRQLLSAGDAEYIASRTATLWSRLDPRGRRLEDLASSSAGQTGPSR